jgi:hypothetical protein
VRVLNVILDMFLKILVVFIYFESLKINIKYAYIYILSYPHCVMSYFFKNCCVAVSCHVCVSVRVHAS